MIQNNKLIHSIIEILKQRRIIVRKEMDYLERQSQKANKYNDLEALSVLNDKYIIYSTELEKIDNLLDYYENANEE